MLGTATLLNVPQPVTAANSQLATRSDVPTNQHRQYNHVLSYRHCKRIVVSCADPVWNVSWMLFPERRRSELRLRREVGQAAHTLNNPQVERTAVLLCVIRV